MKPIILVPTDFSENALLAARFAVNVAAHLNANISLLHAFTWLNSAFQSGQENEYNRKDAEQNARHEMAEFVAHFQETTVSINSIVTEGHLPEAIDRIISGSNVLLVVMGTTGASGLKYHVLGSNTFAVAKQLTKVPLVVVPPGILSFNLNKVAFFTDFNPGDLHTISSFKKVFSPLPEEIHFIHFGRPENRNDEELRLAEWSQTIQNESGIPGLKWSWVEGEEGVEAVARLDEKYDMIILTLAERGFFDNLLTKSMAKELIHQSQIPVFLSK